MKEDVQDKVCDGPQSALSWRRDAISFNNAVIEILRNRDAVLPRVAMDDISRELIGLIPNCDAKRENDFTIMLDRLAALGAASLRFNEHRLFDDFVRTSRNIYLSGFDETRSSRRKRAGGGISGAALWLRVITRIFALGAYAVRLEEWPAIRKLALQSFPEIPHASAGEQEYWLRHATIHAAWEELLVSSDLQTIKGGELVSLAYRVIDEEPALRCDLPQQDERLINSITQFDLLALLIVSTDIGAYNTSYVYPSMAAWGLRRSEPVVLKLLSDAKVRDELFCGRFDEKLVAHCLKEVQGHAYQLNFSHEMGWSSPQVRSLLSKISD